MSGGRLELICTQPPTILAAVIANALDELRPEITEARVDAFTDGAWRLEQGVSSRASRAGRRPGGAPGRRAPVGEGGGRCIATGMGIDLDISRDDEFGLLVRLAPHSINSEALAGSCRVFSSSDTGDHAWFALFPAEAARAARRLAAIGLSFETVLSYRE